MKKIHRTRPQDHILIVKIDWRSLSVLMQTCSQCVLEEHKTASSQQTEETRTIFQTTDQNPEKGGDAGDGEFTVLLSYTQQLDNSGLPWHPL